MERARVRELHYITHFDNVPSILRLGIFSHSRASKLAHVSVADAEVQARRAAVRISGGMALHRYVCLYLDARNAMLYRLLGTSPLAVLAVDPRVLDFEGVIVSDRNAASGTALFRPAASGVEALEEEAVYAEWWNMSRDARQKRCAEVLVPDQIDPSMILHAYVPDGDAATRLAGLVGPQALTIRVDPYCFFRGARRDH